MRNNLRKNRPTGIAPEPTKQGSPGRHLPGVLLNSPKRIHSGHQSPSLFNRRYAFSLVALLAALAFGLLFLLPIGPLQAQNADAIEYLENSMDEVATFTADDPEDRPVYWSLLAADAISTPVDIIPRTDSAEVAHFSISANGVLSFNFPPDYEAPPATNTAAPNTYRVVVVAADEPMGAGNGVLGYKEVTVNVTDVDERGVIRLDAQQPQESRLLTATLIDDDASDAQVSAAEWKWEHSESKNGPWTAILTTTSGAYTPLGVADKYLRATATYTDGHGPDKNAQVVTPHLVRAVPAANNAAPLFPDEDGDADDIQVGRKVDENSPPGTRIGGPVVANDSPGDVLTYTLAAGVPNNDDYRIDPATGQITVGPRTTLDFETNPSDTVTVTATDPMGPTATPTGAATQIVTITINDVNEAPMITAGNTKVTVAENADAAAQGTAAPTYAAYPEASGTACGAATCAWSLEGADAGDFEIGNQTAGTLGQLTFETAPNYESPADANGDNVYMVTVVVTDAGIDGKGKLSAERDVVVTVTNVNEGTPETVVTLSSLVPKVGVPLTATLDDPDGGEKDIEWQWSIADAATAGVPGTPTATLDGPIDGAESDTYIPKINDIGGNLTAMVMYADAVGSDRTGTKAAANPVVRDLAAKAPVFKPKPTSRSVPENYAMEDTYGGTGGNDFTYPAVGAVVTATDPNGDTLTYSLGGDAGSFDIDQMTGQIRVKPATKLNLEAKPTYMVTVTATDPGGLSDSVDVTIKLTDEDEGPEIAGDDVSRDYPENGTGSVATLRAMDPEGRRTVYWSLLATGASGTPEDITPGTDSAEVAHFSISASGVLSFNFPPDYEASPTTNTDAPNTYRVVVVAADEPMGAGNGVLGYKKVTVNVTNMEETETVTLSARQGQVAVPLTATYNDLDNERPDATPLAWKWYLGGSEIVDASDATDLTSAYTPDRGGSHRAEASYTKADGSKKSASATISVRTAPSSANVSPAFPSGSDRRSVDENSPPGTRVGSAVTATDPGDVLTYTFSGGANASSYSINAATGQITVGARTALDREAIGGNFTHTVNVTATDPAGGAATQIVTITINDVNEAPMITAGNTKVTVAENADAAAQGTAAPTYAAYPEASGTACGAATCAWSLEGADAGDFEIGNQTAGTLGQLTFETAPNYESPADANGDNVYMVTVVVTDAGIDGKGKLSAERDVVVTVTNVNEGTPETVVTLSSLVPKVGVPLTATLDDPDGGEKDIEWQWSIADAATAGVPGTPTATLDGPIDGAESDTYIPKINDIGGNLTAMVMYADAVGSDRTGTKAAANPVVRDLAAKAPVFKPKPTSRSVPENYAMGDTYGGTGGNDFTYPAVGAVVTATDPNGDTLTYSLGGDAGSFDIDQMTGQIRVKPATKLNLEAKPTYMVTVTATDPGGLSDSVDVTIKLTDVDEAPEIMVGGLAISGTPRVSLLEGSMTTVGSYTAAGSNAASARWTLEGDDRSDFMLQPSSGMSVMLKFRNAPNYEAPADTDTDNVYMVTLKATDSESNTAMRAVTVTVTNVDEDGTVTLSSTTPSVGTEITAILTDLDSPDGVTGATWQWARSDASDGIFTDISGAMSASYTPVEADVGMYLRAMASYTDGHGSGKSEDAVTANAVAAEGTAPGEGTLLERYDTNNNGTIDQAEVEEALDDYFFGQPRLSQEDVEDVLELYFFP